MGKVDHHPGLNLHLCGPNGADIRVSAGERLSWSTAFGIAGATIVARVRGVRRDLVLLDVGTLASYARKPEELKASGEASAVAAHKLARGKDRGSAGLGLFLGTVIGHSLRKEDTAATAAGTPCGPSDEGRKEGA